MQNNYTKLIDDTGIRASSQPEIDYSPKTYNIREQIVYGLKFLSISGTILLIFWLLEKYVTH